MLDDDGISFQLFGSEAALQQAILDEEIGSGITFPENLFQDVAAGRKPTVTIYVPSDVDDDIKNAMQVVVEAMTLTLTGRSLNIEANEVIPFRQPALKTIHAQNISLGAHYHLTWHMLNRITHLAGRPSQIHFTPEKE